MENENSQKPGPKVNEFDKLNYEDDTIILRRYLGLFLSNWYWFAVTFFLAGVLAYGINNYAERLYIVSASILIKDDLKSSDLSGQDRFLPGVDMFRSQQNLQNEMGILRSYSLNYRVMNKLPDFHLALTEVGRRGIAQKRHYKSAPIIILYDSLKNERTDVRLDFKIRSDNTYSVTVDDGESTKRPYYAFGELFNEAGFKFRVVKRDSAGFRFNPKLSNRYIIRFLSTKELANEYRAKIKIDPINEESTLVNLTVAGAIPSQESEYLNMLMDEYIQQGLDFKNETAKKTIEFIDGQIKVVSDSLSKAELSLADFKHNNQLIDLTSEGSSIKSRIDEYSKEKISAGLQKQYFEYLLKYIKSRNESEAIVSPSIMGVTDPLMIKLVDELGILQNQKKQLNYNLKENQPAVALVDSKINDVRNALYENVFSGIENVNRTLNDIDSRIRSVDDELGRLPSTERTLINIQRRYELNNTVYNYMLEKKSEAGIAEASNVSSNRTIDRAEPDIFEMISPKIRRNYLLALLLGLLIPGIYIFLIDQLHTKILDKRDIEKGTQVPIIGFVGHNVTKNEIPVISRPGSSLSESFRSIRTSMKYYLEGKNKAMISITSTISGEGKTFISLNLAAVMALLNRKTLLVGVDLRKPRLDKILNPGGGKGLSSFLIGESEFDEILRETEVANLFFVPSGPVPPNPSELIESAKMREFMETAKQEFDYIILDTPPIGIVSDAMLLGVYADVNIFVIRQRFSFKSTLEYIQNIFEKEELKNLAIAVNDIHISGYYGYGLRYGYGFYEGYGYNYGYSSYASYHYGNYSNYYTED